jgi:hypothetical protein
MNLLLSNVDKTKFMQFKTKTSSLINLNIMHKNKEIVNAYNTKFIIPVASPWTGGAAGC